MDTREAMIEKYFSMWIKRDFTGLDEIFSSAIYYSECYGPEYQGLEEMHLWIDMMLKKQEVLKWQIKQYIHQKNITIVEWFFQDKIKEKITGFDGVSIIEFDYEEKIVSVKEFQSKAEHIAPFR